MEEQFFATWEKTSHTLASLNLIENRPLQVRQTELIVAEIISQNDLITGPEQTRATAETVCNI